MNLPLVPVFCSLEAASEREVEVGLEGGLGLVNLSLWVSGEDLEAMMARTT